MDNKLNLTFTEEEYIALARQKYQDLQTLKSKPAFYDYVLDKTNLRIGRILKSPDYQDYERTRPRVDRFSVETY